MKLVRYGQPGKEKPGLIDAAGALRDLSAVLPDIGPAQLSPQVLAKLAKLKTDKLPLVRGKPRMGCPVAHVPKFIAIGLNYADHAAEANMPIPKEPIVFMKATSCIQGPNDDVMLPKGSLKSDWEVELGIVIGTRASYVSQKDALSYVAGYCTINDVSERAYQLELGGTWDKGKGCDTFGPIGPWMVTKRRSAQPAKLAHVAGAERPAHAKRQHQDHDFWRCQIGQLRQPIHDFGARRHHHHRHASRCGHGREERWQTSPDLFEKGRCHELGHRGLGLANTKSAGLQTQAINRHPKSTLKPQSGSSCPLRPFFFKY